MAAILDFFKVAPRLILKVRSQGIIMPKMALVSIMVRIVTLSHQTTYASLMITRGGGGCIRRYYIGNIWGDMMISGFE